MTKEINKNLKYRPYNIPTYSTLKWYLPRLKTILHTYIMSIVHIIILYNI